LGCPPGQRVFGKPFHKSIVFRFCSDFQGVAGEVIGFNYGSHALYCTGIPYIRKQFYDEYFHSKTSPLKIRQ
jgi:hypothetical protein